MAQAFIELFPWRREYRGKPIPVVDNLKRDRTRLMLRKLKRDVSESAGGRQLDHLNQPARETDDQIALLDGY